MLATELIETGPLHEHLGDVAAADLRGAVLDVVRARVAAAGGWSFGAWLERGRWWRR